MRLYRQFGFKQNRIGRFMPKSYGQLGQDLLALAYFRFYPAESKAFLDVGAFDGISFSNVRLFFEEGWSGVCIEPCLKNYKKLELLYKDTSVVTVRAAATDYEGELELNVATIPWAKEWGSDVSSQKRDTIERWPDYVWEKETVPATTVDQVLESNHLGHIDFASIDVEGQEMEVLRGFDLHKYRPQLLVVEYSNTAERKDLIEYLRHQGYFLWSDNGQDIFAVRGSKMAHLKILFKGWWPQIGRLLDKLKAFLRRSR
jgi:FkbM family methyltransferase